MYKANFILYENFKFLFIYSPPDPKINITQHLLSVDEKLNLALIGSLPGKAIRQIRVHWLLNMISINV